MSNATSSVNNENQRHSFSRFFLITMWYRIVYGVARIGVAMILLSLVGLPLLHALAEILPQALFDEPTDFLPKLFHFFLGHHNLKVTYFVIVYLGFWGAVDIILSVCILRNKIWAYPVSMWLIVVFVAYEILRLTQTHSPILLFFIGVDAFVFWLIWREYRQVKS